MPRRPFTRKIVCARSAPSGLRRCCLRGEGESQGQVLLQDKIRSRVQFGQLNLCKPIEGLGPFDFVFLRNVLIYFDPPTRWRSWIGY